MKLSKSDVAVSGYDNNIMEGNLISYIQINTSLDSFKMNFINDYLYICNITTLFAIKRDVSL